MHSVLALEGWVSLASAIGIGNAAVAAQDPPTLLGAWRILPQALDTAANGAVPNVADQ